MSEALPAYMPTIAERRLGLLSIVAPLYDEEATLRDFVDRLWDACAEMPFELIAVDDGSRDRTPEILDELAAADARVKVLRLSRNFGHQTALTAGLDHASGDAVVMLDGDLQDPPELIPAMVEHWRRGSDVVYGVRQERIGETRFKLLTARLFYRVISALSQVDLPPHTGDFRLLDRRALDSLLSMRERNRFLRGMTIWVGYTQTAVPYERDARFAGHTKYTLRRMLRFSIDAVSSFSHVPLQLATLLGFAFSLIAFVSLPLVVLARLAGIYVPGISSVLFTVLLLGGIQLITVGVIGEYVGRIYDEVKRRPLYLVRERRNLPEAEAESKPERERVST